MTTLCITPCGTQKIWDKSPNKGPTEAKDVYIGVFAKKCSEYAKKFYPYSWCILSAKHGFLLPDDLVPGPYDVSFKIKNSKPISFEDLYLQIIEKKLDKYDQIVVLGGKSYTQIVQKLFDSKDIYNPLVGCKGIGYMTQKINSLINES